MGTWAAAPLTADERADLLLALRYPRGRYSARRAAQLSGVPERTIYHWAMEGVLSPDFHKEQPKAWSYRDLVYLRLTAFLRAHAVDLSDAITLTGRLREEFSQPEPGIATTISASAGGYAFGSEMSIDELSGQTAFETMARYVATFDISAAIEEPQPVRRLRGPHLVRPSERTAISPWVLSGEPVVRESRIATVSLLRLHEDRMLNPTDIAALYPTLDVVDVEDAIRLEISLRHAA